MRFSAISVVTVLMLSCACAIAQENKAGDELSPDAIKQRISQYRTAQATLTLSTSDGKPLANTPVVIRQVRHKFLFGCNGFGINTADKGELQQGYQKRFSELLNFATLGFYWGTFERTEGKPDTERLRMMAKWCEENHIRTKGHPLCWQQVFPRWLLNRPLEEVQKLQMGRITREVTDFAGRIDAWDVVNEAVSMPSFKQERTLIPELCKQLGRVELVKQAFAAARKANPGATLILNDYDTSPNYEKLIRECLDAGISIDVIGIQCHQHTSPWGARQAWEICQRFAKFGKPLHFTETTFISGEIKKNINWYGREPNWPSTPEGEERQARQVVEFYTILFSHPAVQAITWWDFSDRNAWLGAPAGLVRTDMSPKPAYEALMKLIKQEWWTGEVKAATDASGKVSFTGFLGDYALESSAGSAKFALNKNGTLTLTAVVAK